MRARLDTPEMLDMARDLAGSRPKKPEDLVLEFHDPLLPTVLTAAGCVIATAVCLFAVIDGFKSNTGFVAGAPVNLWVVAAFAGAFSVMFSALSFMRTFSIRFDTLGMASRVSGSRWRQLRVGAMCGRTSARCANALTIASSKCARRMARCSRFRCGWGTTRSCASTWRTWCGSMEIDFRAEFSPRRA